jgi:heme-degrading monooxygenase HmoA
MVTELANLPATPGQEDAFAAAYAEGSKLLLAAPGCRSARLLRGVESPSLFVAIVEWDSVEDHQTYLASPAFATFGGLIGDFIGGPVTVEHFTES